MRGSESCRSDHHAVLGAGIDVDVPGAASGLADKFELGQALDHYARKRRACLGQNDRFGLSQALGQTNGILFRIVVDQKLVLF